MPYKLVPQETISMTCQSLFSEEKKNNNNKKNFFLIILLSTKFAQRVVKVKGYL